MPVLKAASHVEAKAVGPGRRNNPGEVSDREVNLLRLAVKGLDGCKG
jgi:hypothetical protein